MRIVKANLNMSSKIAKYEIAICMEIFIDMRNKLSVSFDAFSSEMEKNQFFSYYFPHLAFIHNSP